VHEIRNQHPNGRILRRKVAWLLGKWVSKVYTLHMRCCICADVVQFCVAILSPAFKL
jgi:hypothetical protein